VFVTVNHLYPNLLFARLGAYL